MTRLCELATKYGTDKAGYYTPFYDLILGGRDVRKVLEIGIGTPEAMKHVPGYEPGASLRMWAEYFPEAMIYGIDTDRTAVLKAKGGQIQCVVADQQKRSELIVVAQKAAWANGGIDLIVDDGDHSAKSQIFTAVHLMPFLAPGGLYIIEDAAPDCAPPFEYFEVRGSRGARLILIRKPDGE